MSVFFPGSAPLFSLTGKHRARVIGVHDGDTIKCIIRLYEDFYTFNVRVYGIDTPEMKGSTKDIAIKARNRLIEMLTQKQFTNTTDKKKDIDSYFQQNYTEIDLECLEMDKYGRVLANIGNCADVMVNEGLAHRYYGKTKESFD